MKSNLNIRRISFNLCLSVVSLFLFTLPFFAQTKTLLKRTTYKTEKAEFGAGGTVSVVGAPVGSIEIEGWRKNEVEITAEIEVQAESENDLAQLAAVSGFTLDVTMGRLSVTSVGTHDKDYLKRAAGGKKFPKNLLNMPFRVDYKIKVPLFSDLEIDGGRGAFVLSNVEGAMRINFLETNAKIKLSGGAVVGTFGSGDVEIEFLQRSWRGSGVDIQMANGTMNLSLPANLNAEVDAKVLRTGKIENSYALLKPRDRTKFSEKLITAKSGAGGATFSFTIGDGELKIAGNEK
jgi:hypothetical protein